MTVTTPSRGQKDTQYRTLKACKMISRRLQGEKAGGMEGSGRAEHGRLHGACNGCTWWEKIQGEEDLPYKNMNDNGQLILRHFSKGLGTPLGQDIDKFMSESWGLPPNKGQSAWPQ